MGFRRRRIDLEFQLGQGDFGKAGFDTVRVSGLRVTATVTRSGGAQMSELNMRVFGLPLDVMNKLTILNILQFGATRRNNVILSAGDDGGVSVCFIGTIVECWADISQPEAFLYVRAAVGYVQRLEPVAPVSYKGTVDAAFILAGLAARWTSPTARSLTLENSGVTVQLSNPYYPGTLLEQIHAVAQAGNFYAVIDEVAGRLAIWPAGGVRGGLSTLISAESGMVGYPTYAQSGIQLTTLYNPALAFGTTVEVRSQLLPASGLWGIGQVIHDLESEVPGGKWFTRLECYLLGHSGAPPIT